VVPKFVSPSDPAAQWTGAMKGAAFFAYADNYLIDVKYGIIMDVEASRATQCRTCPLAGKIKSPLNLGMSKVPSMRMTEKGADLPRTRLGEQSQYRDSGAFQYRGRAL
jgi:hypothetical protein